MSLSKLFGDLVNRINILSAMAVTMSFLLVSCGGASSSGSSGGDAPGESLTLTLTAPNAYPAGIASTAYLTIINTSSLDANGLEITVPENSNTTGATIEVNEPNPCSEILAESSCTFSVNIESSSHSGSFSVTATSPDSGTLISSRGSLKAAVGNLWTKAKSLIGIKATAIELTANIGLVEVATNNAAGANGISMLYASPIISAAESTPVTITAYVSSANAGIFNTINLTTANSTLLDFIPVSNNSGATQQPLGQGAVVTFNALIPAGADSYTFYAQTMNDGIPVSQGTESYTIILLPVTETTGILTVQPYSFGLTTSYESQILTYTNTGNGVISGLTIATESPLSVLHNECGSTLSIGASCNYIVGFDSSILDQAGISNITASYNNGQTTTTTTAQAAYIGAKSYAQISIESVILNPIASTGNGSAESPFWGESMTSYTMTIVYKNSGNGVAESFMIGTSNLLESGYSRDGSSNCMDTPGSSLESNGATCSLVLNLPQNVVGAENLSLESAHLPVSWIDSVGVHESQGINWINSAAIPESTQDMIYVNMYATAVVTACISSNNSGCVATESLGTESAFYLYYTMTGGYLGQTLSYTPTYPTGMQNSSGVCMLINTGANSVSCTVNMNTGNPAYGTGTIGFGGSSGGITPTPASESISVTQNPAQINYTYSIAAGESVGVTTSFTATATLESNGYMISNQSIESQSLSPSSESITFTNAPCLVSSESSTCTLSINIGSTANTESYILVLHDATSNITESNQSITFTVIIPRYYVFVTSTTYDGDLGGFAGADTRCQTRANVGSATSPLNKTWKAIIQNSTGSNNATVSGRNYYLVNGTTFVATANGGNLVGVNNGQSGTSLSNKLNLNENGATREADVYTGYYNDNGNVDNCADWTSNSNTLWGTYGQSQWTDEGWWRSSRSQCNVQKSLYCASQ